MHQVEKCRPTQKGLYIAYLLNDLLAIIISLKHCWLYVTFLLLCWYHKHIMCTQARDFKQLEHGLLHKTTQVLVCTWRIFDSCLHFIPKCFVENSAGPPLAFRWNFCKINFSNSVLWLSNLVAEFRTPSSNGYKRPTSKRPRAACGAASAVFFCSCQHKTRQVDSCEAGRHTWPVSIQVN